MVASALINYATAFIMVVSIVSAIGPDLETVLNSPTGQPWVEIIRMATGSQAATIVLLVLVCFLFTTHDVLVDAPWIYSRSSLVDLPFQHVCYPTTPLRIARGDYAHNAEALS